MKITVGGKLLGMGLTSAVLTVAVGVVGWWGISSIAGATSRTMNGEARIAQHAARVRANTLGLRRYEKDIFINIHDPKKVEEYVKKFGEQHEHLTTQLEALKSVTVLPQDKERVAQMSADVTAYLAGMTGILEKVKAGQIKTAEDGNRAVNEYKGLIHRLEKTAEDFARDGNKRMDDIEGVLDGKATSTLWTTSALVAVAAAVGLVLSTLLARSVTRPLTSMVDMLKDIAEGEGDLTKRVSIDSHDEVGETAHWFNVFIGKVQEIMAQVKQAADQAAVASQQLSAAAEQLSSGAQEQASSLEETAASLEQITGTVKQNADNSRQADQLSVSSRDVAEKGGQVVTDAVQSMGAINQASKKIAAIITTIDEIAFQTNLLALNAAVEAARAGEQGRGFAVVASEVRNLAQRSAAAAKEIKGLIEDSMAKVETGAALVNQSGEKLREIVTSVKRVTDIIGEIAAASTEQTTGIDEVNKAVTQMDQVTQANAAQTEELSSTAQALAAQAEQLQALISRFKLGEERPGVPAHDRSHVGAPVVAKRSAPRPTPPKPPAAKGSSGKPAPALVASHATNGHGAGDGFEEF